MAGISFTGTELGLAVFSLPEAHRRRLRTTKLIERLNKEVKRLTRVATLLPNEASLLRLVAAIFMETSDELQSLPRYLNTSPKSDPA